MDLFLSSLIYGLKEIPKNKRYIIEILTRFQALINSNLVYKLKDNYLIGYISKKDDKLCFLKSLQPLSLLKDPKVINSKNLMQDDLVLAKLDSKKSYKYRFNIRVLYVFERKNINVIGVLQQKKDTFYIVDIRTNTKLDIKASQKSLKLLPKNCLFEVDISNKKILNVIGVIDDAKLDLKIVLKIFNKNVNFSEEILEFVKSFDFKINIKSYSNRVDLTYLPFITIDPYDAKDFDDAIYFDGENIFVAIADVSYYVPHNSIIDKEAFNRGFSIYLSNFVVPMLPPLLSNNLCSLKKDENRLAFVWKIKVDKSNFEVIESSLFEAVIKVKENFNYEDVNNAILGLSNLDKEFSFINQLYSIASNLRKIRLKNGIEFINDEFKIILDKNDEISKVIEAKELESNKLVEECMLLANKESAKLCLDGGGVFRVHDVMSSEKLLELIIDLSFLDSKKNIKNKSLINAVDVIYNIQKSMFNLPKHIIKALHRHIITYMPKAKYSPKNIGHFALGFAYYCHFTSPIRRYSDLLIHRILKEKLISNDKQVNFLTSNLDSICDRLNNLQNDINKIELSFKDRKFARYYNNKLNNNENLIEDCIVTDDGYPSIGKLLSNGVRIFLDKEYNKLLVLRVQIISSDIISGKIQAKSLEIINEFILNEARKDI